MKTIIFVLLFALLIDGIKLLIESFSSYKKKKFSSDHSLVSVIIPLFNKEKEIGKVLKSVLKLFPKENIFVVNDGSTDNSLGVAGSTAPDIHFFSIENQGKVRAIEGILEHIITPFVLLLDADVVLPEGFRCPTSLINGSITAVAFNVMPEYDQSKKKSLILEFQSHEYAKSMQIGRKFQDKTASVHCVSGAIGLFKTARLKEFTKNHTKLWPGEDLERTLIELVSDGKVIYVDQLIKTEVPRKIWQLIAQRVIGWWPGLWRNIFLFFKVGLKKNIPLRLRIEMAYQLFSLFTDPLKFLALIVIIATENWVILGTLYLIYLVLEAMTYLRMRNGYTKRPVVVIALYFFYNLLQMILRLGGLMIFFWNRIIKKRWVGVATSFLLLVAILFPLNALAKDDGILSVSYQKILDSNGRTINNCNLYLGYKGFYLDANTAKQAPRYLIVGKYLKYKEFIFVPEIRIKDYDKTLKLTVEKPLFKPVVGRISASYSFTKEINNFPILQIGGDYYWGDYNYTSLDAIKEFGRKYATTFILKNHAQFRNGLYIKAGIAVNNFLDKGYFVTVGFKQIFLGYSSFQNFDYYEFNRKYLTVGAKFKF